MWRPELLEVRCPLASPLVLAFWHGIVSLSTKITCEIPAGCLQRGDVLVESLGTTSDAQQRSKQRSCNR